MENNNLDATASLNQSTPIGYYKWYPRDFLSSITVRSMSMTAQGIYRALLDLQWESGILPSYEKCCFIYRMTEAEADSFREFFDVCFPNGRNPKLHALREQAILDREKQSEKGKASADAKAKNKQFEPKHQPEFNNGSTGVQQRFNSGSTTVQPEFNQTETETETETEAEKETETIKVKKDANAPSSRKGKVDYHSLAQEAGFEDDMFLKAWSEFVEHRREIKHPMSERAANLILAKLKKFSVEVGVESINRSISSGWRDVFPEKASIQNRKSKPFGKPSKLGSALEYYSDNLEEIRATKAIDSDIIDAEIVS
jgi:uncharacterized protein YdaU (DUF1376 family)